MDHEGTPPGDSDTGSVASVESSLDLLRRAQAGDRQALEALLARYLPRLQRWSSGRLPRWARDMSDTQDLVQETLIQTLRNLDGFEPRHEGALQAYLRQGVLNRIRNEIRKVGRRPPVAELDPEVATDDASPLEEAIGGEALERYERALASLRPADREAIIARIEMGCTNEELAVVLGKPSANAARMAVERALVRLAEEMSREHD